MNEKEFEQSLRCGLGNAILELKRSDDKAKYRDAVLRCCLNDITFDRQCEGTKGFYLYSAICELGAKDEFEQVIVDKFLTPCTLNFFCQLAGIVYCYADDGSELSKDALYQKYDYFVAKNGRLSANKQINEYYQWEIVAGHLYDIEGFSAFKRHIIDLGKLLCENPRRKKISYDLEGFLIGAKDDFEKKRIETFFENQSKKSIQNRRLGVNFLLS